MSYSLNSLKGGYIGEYIVPPLEVYMGFPKIRAPFLGSP